MNCLATGEAVVPLVRHKTHEHIAASRGESVGLQAVVSDIASDVAEKRRVGVDAVVNFNVIAALGAVDRASGAEADVTAFDVHLREVEVDGGVLGRVDAHAAVEVVAIAVVTTDSAAGRRRVAVHTTSGVIVVQGAVRAAQHRRVRVADILSVLDEIPAGKPARVLRRIDAAVVGVRLEADVEVLTGAHDGREVILARLPTEVVAGVRPDQRRCLVRPVVDRHPVAAPRVGAGLAARLLSRALQVHLREREAHLLPSRGVDRRVAVQIVRVARVGLTAAVRACPTVDRVSEAGRQAGSTHTHTHTPGCEQSTLPTSSSWSTPCASVSTDAAGQMPLPPTPPGPPPTRVTLSMKCQSTKKPYESGCEMRSLTGEMTGEATAGTGSSETASWEKPALPVSVWKRMKTSGPVDTRGAGMSVPEKLPRMGERASGPSYTVTVSQPASRGRRISQHAQRQRAGAGGGCGECSPGCGQREPVSSAMYVKVSSMVLDAGAWMCLPQSRLSL